LFPSTYEGFGLPVIEAFATGKPVITSNISPMKEVASNSALLIDPTSIASIREAVRYFISEPDQRNHFAAVGKLRVLDFLPVQITDHYKRLWYQIG
jgi:glycosyltransferase involved in cell wall biosynthesis